MAPTNPTPMGHKTSYFAINESTWDNTDSKAYYEPDKVGEKEESTKAKRDRLSRENNKKLMDARLKGKKLKW